MKGKNQSLIVIVCILVLSFVFSSCAPVPAPAQPTAAPVQPTAVPAQPTAVPVQPTAVPAQPTAAPAQPTAAPAGPAIKLAVIIPGPIQDADYNMLGYNASQDVGKSLGITSEYSEQVAVADAGNVAKQYIDRGFNVIAFHGGQFTATVQDMAPKFPDVVFIAESGGPDKKLELPNVWNIGRRVYLGQYAYGVLAARMTKTKKVAFLAGQKFANFVSSINTIDAAIAATDPSVKLIYTFTGDQNDLVKGTQGAKALMDQGADFLIIDLNAAKMGAAEAIKSAANPVYFSSLYTDINTVAPKNFTSAPIYDFTGVFTYIVNQVKAGTKTGYYDMKPGNGIKLSPFYNVPDAIQKEMQAAWDKVASGEIKLVEDQSDIKIRQ